jgi:hypothetical protein
VVTIGAMGTYISDLNVNHLTAGDITVAVDIGNPASGYVRLDGENNRIVINDGTTNRIIIGEI